MKTLSSILILIMIMVSGCQTVKDIVKIDDQKQWEDETKENSFYELIDDIFGSDDKLEIKRMVQVGTKDGVPVYELATNDQEVKKLEEKGKKKKPRKKKIKEKRVKKAIVNLRDDEYLHAVENIRLQKLGYNTKTGKHKEIEKLARQGKKAELVYNEEKKTYDAVIVEDEPLVIEEDGKEYMTKAGFVSKQMSSEFNAENNLGPKQYAPEYVVDSKSKGKKGAVQLVWTKTPKNVTYQLEIIRDQKVFIVKQKWHVMHIMVYWDKDYLWRVRVLDNKDKPLSAFSNWKPLKIVRPEGPVQPKLAKKVRPKPVVRKPVKRMDDRDAASVIEEMHMDEGGE